MIGKDNSLNAAKNTLNGISRVIVDYDDQIKETVLK